jgi:hypothetical protein
MYDYLILRKNAKYSDTITKADYKNLFSEYFNFDDINNRTVKIVIDTEKIQFIAIKCDPNGNYNFDDEKIPEEINLIEIQLPRNISLQLEKNIKKMILKINSRLHWELIDHEDYSIIEKI